MPTPPPPRLRLIGPPALFSPTGTPLPFRTRKQLALLVVLHLDGRSHGVMRDRLVDFFWPDVGDRRGRHSLSQGLTAIRGLLGEGAVTREGQYVRLHAKLGADLEMPIGAAVDGPPPLPLEDFDHLGGVEFAHWVDAARSRILRSVRVTLLREIEALRARGELQLVHERAATLYRVDPGNDTAVHVLAEHAVDSGDQIGATALLEEFLEREDKRLNSQQRSSLRRHLARVRTRARPTPVITRAEARSTVFVAREEETRRLQAWWNALPEVNTLTVMVSGPTGVGKTTLIHRFAQFAAADGHLVIRATCQPIARQIPFATLAALMESLGGDPELGATDPHWLGEASRVAPFLSTQFAGIPRPAPTTGDTVRLAVAEAFHQMLETVSASGPVLLVIDDAQHLDPATRDVLSLLARRPRVYPILTLALVQTPWDEADGPEDDDAPLPAWDDQLPVRPLEPPASRELAAALCDATDPDAADRPRDLIENLVRLSDGVPYFLETLVEDWRTHGDASLARQTLDGHPATEWEPPPSVQAAFARRHRRLDAVTRQVLEAVALAAHRVTPEQIAHLLSLPLDQVNRAVLGALRRGDLTAEMSSVAFRNEIHRGYVYHSINEPRRIYLHSRLAEELTAPHAPEIPADHTVQAAYHFFRAGAVDQAHHCAAIGARAAIRHGAPKEAERIIQTVTKGNHELAPPELTLLHAEALNLQGRYEDALAVLSADRPDGLTQSHRAAMALAEASSRGGIGSLDRIRDNLEQAKRAALDAGDHASVAKALLLTGELTADNRDWNGLDAVLAEVEARATPHDNQMSAGHLTMAFCSLARGNHVRAEYSLVQAITALRDRRDFGGLIKALNAWGVVAAATGHLTAARTRFQEAYDRASELRDHVMACNIANNRATVLVDFGCYDESRDWFDRALFAHQKTRGNRYGATLFANLADLCLIEGRFEEAERHLALAERDANRRRIQWTEVLQLARADLFIAQGEVMKACDAISEVEKATNQSLDQFRPRSVPGFDSSNLFRHMYYRRLMTCREDIALVSPFEGPDEPMHVSTFVELIAFVEWAAEITDTKLTQILTAAKAFRATGLDGVMDRLKRLRMLSRRATLSRPIRPSVRHGSGDLS